MQKDGVLDRHLRAFGCPMDDQTLWKQSQSGELFESPLGIRTAAFWLPCVSNVDPMLPGTCASCAFPGVWDYMQDALYTSER